MAPLAQGHPPALAPAPARPRSHTRARTGPGQGQWRWMWQWGSVASKVAGGKHPHSQPRLHSPPRPCRRRQFTRSRWCQPVGWRGQHYSIVLIKLLVTTIFLCELENIRLADAADFAVPALPLAPASLPVHRAILSCADLHTLFSKLEPCSTLVSAIPLSSVDLAKAALNDELAELWKWSYMESGLLLKIHAGQNGNLCRVCTSINEFEHWFHFHYCSLAEHIPGWIHHSPSSVLHSVQSSCRV